MTSELKPGQYIEEFLRGGHKIYAYKIVDPVSNGRKTVCEVSGITLKYSASQLVKFDVIKNMFLKGYGTQLRCTRKKK